MDWKRIAPKPFSRSGTAAAEKAIRLSTKSHALNFWSPRAKYASVWVTGTGTKGRAMGRAMRASRRNVERETVSAGDKRDVWNFACCRAKTVLRAARPPRPNVVGSKKPALPANDPALVGENLPTSRCRCARASSLARRLGVGWTIATVVETSNWTPKKILACRRRGTFGLLLPAA